MKEEIRELRRKIREKIAVTAETKRRAHEMRLETNWLKVVADEKELRLIAEKRDLLTLARDNPALNERQADDGVHEFRVVETEEELVQIEATVRERLEANKRERAAFKVWFDQTYPRQ